MEHNEVLIRLNYKKEGAVVKVVTTDSQSWSLTKKYRWLFYFGFLLSLIMAFSSCVSHESNEAGINPADTVGLAAFKAQKQIDSMADAGQQLEGQEVPIEYNNDQLSPDESGAIKSINDENGHYASGNTSGGAVDDNFESGSMDGEQSSPTEQTRKKRISNASKGALIGAGSGAVIGAVVTKRNRGLGAVIGAAVGGGAGYGIGKHKDNKEARGE